MCILLEDHEVSVVLALPVTEGHSEISSLAAVPTAESSLVAVYVTSGLAEELNVRVLLRFAVQK